MEWSTIAVFLAGVFVGQWVAGMWIWRRLDRHRIRTAERESWLPPIEKWS